MAKSESPPEQNIIMPKGWHRFILPRQGGNYSPKIKRLAPEKAWDRCEKALKQSIEAPRKRWERAQQAVSQRAFSLDEALDTGFSLSLAKEANKARSALVDLWVSMQGEAFATSAVVGTHKLVNQSPMGTDFWWDYDYFYRLRCLLAVAPFEQYEEAKRAAAALRTDADLQTLVKIAFLFPSEQGWVKDHLREASHREYSWLLATVEDPVMAGKLASAAAMHGFQRGPQLLFPTFLDGLGVKSGPILAKVAQHKYMDSAGAKNIGRALAAIPCRESLRSLLLLADEHKSAVPCLHNSLTNFPRLALKVLSEERRHDLWTRTVLSGHPHLPEELSAELSPAQFSYLQNLQESEDRPKAAPLEKCPTFLLDPPWNNRIETKRKVLNLTQPTHDGRTAWQEGERKRWSANHPVEQSDRDLEQYYGDLEPWQRNAVHTGLHVVTAPEKAARELLANWEPDDPWYVNEQFRGVIARFETEALPALLYFSRRKLADAVPFFAPFDSTDLCLRAAEAFGRLKSVRRTALRYLSRYPDTAARALIPPAFGRKKKERDYAENALLALAGSGHRETILRIAEEYEAGEDVAALLGRDPLQLLPRTIPSLPHWLEPNIALIHPPELSNGEGALPDEAVANLCLMLALSKPDTVYAGVEKAALHCTQESLREFAWQLFELWLESGSPTGDKWAFWSLGWLGDDEVARRLTPLMKKWPGEGGHARAVVGLDVLTTIGTDVALMHLYGLSQKLKFKGLKNKAGEKVAEIAENRGLTPDELGDRLIPDLGLDQDGSMTLDYGPRHFRVGFDEQLKPYIVDEDGKQRKTLPKPGKRDGECADEAYKLFKNLKKDVKTVGRQQIQRLELAMCNQRRWSCEDFRRFFLEHPLVIHLVSRLVWGLYEEGELKHTFRVAEDRSLADSQDEEWLLPTEGRVGLPHKIEMNNDLLAAWGELFSDYELLQPFPQLSREVYLPPKGWRELTELDLLEGTTLPTVRVLGLEQRGWRRGEALDGGVSGWMLKPLSEERIAFLNFEPGIAMGDPTMFEQQILGEVTLGDGTRTWDATATYTFGELTEVNYSELIRDLEWLRE